jgi:hypothetical protein
VPVTAVDSLAAVYRTGGSPRSGRSSRRA